MKSLLRGRLRRATSGNRSHHRSQHVEAVEPRVLLSVDVSYDGATTTRFSWDAAAGARPILEAPPAQPSLFDQQFVAPIGSRMFLRIAGIEGEATDKQHLGQIELLGFSWSLDHVTNPAGSSGGADAEAPDFAELRVASRLSKASPKLMDAVVLGSTFADADFTIASSTSGVDFYRVDLDNVNISSYQVTTAADGNPLEEFTLRFSAASLDYSQLLPDGRYDSPVHFAWNAKPNGGTVADTAPPLSKSLLDQAPAALASNLDLFLRLDGIPGESTDAKHPNEINLSGFSWGLDGRQNGAPLSGPLRLMAPVSKASPKIMEALALGTHIPTADLTARRVTAVAQVDYYKVHLIDVQIDSYRLTTALDGTTLEEFTLAFGGTSLNYYPIDIKGGMGPAVSFAWASANVVGVGVNQPSLLDTAPVTTGPIDTFLRMDGVVGESVDARHPREIDIDAFSWAVDARPAAQEQYSELRLAARVSKASPKLMELAATGTHVPNADLTSRRSGGTQIEFYKLDLTDVVVTSYRLTTAADGNLMEEFTLGFGGFTLEYVPEFNGRPGSPVTFAQVGAAVDVTESAPSHPPLLVGDAFAPLAANLDGFLRLDGIPGDSIDAKHPNEINLSAFAWAEDPHPAGAVQFHELRLAAPASKASPQLLSAMSLGTSIPDADVTIRRVGSVQVDFYKLDLVNAHVTSYQVSTRADGTPVEEITLSFTGFTLVYVPIDASGRVLPAVQYAWDPAASPGTVAPAAPAPAQSLLDEPGFTPAQSNLDMFLRLPGIEGDSVDSKHRGQIDVYGFSWGAHPAGRETQIVFDELRFVSRVGKASPLIMKALAEGTTIPDGDFAAVRQSALGAFTFYALRLENIQIGSYRVTTGPDGTMLEEFTLRFTNLAFDYVPQNSDGTAGTPVHFLAAQTTVQDAPLRQTELLDAGFAAPATGTSMLLSISGIRGASQDFKYADAIDIAAFSWGVRRSGERGPDFTELRFVSRTSRATPKLMQALTDGTWIPSADFVVRKLGVKTEEFYQVHLEGVIVSSYRITTARDGSPAEEFTLSFDHPAPPPTVTQVYVGSSGWSDSFKGYLQSQRLGSSLFGFAIAGGAAQLLALPWASLDQVSIAFSDPVDVEQDDLRVYGVSVPSYGIVGFTYDAAARTATWKLDRAAAADKLLLDLDGDSPAGVRGTTGPQPQLLDGNWVTGQSAYPSGDGTPGGDFRMRLNFLRGDVTRSGRVDALDLRRLVARLGTSLTKPGASPYTYDVFHDVTGDGKIDAFDWAAVRTGFFRGLPVGEPAVPAVQSPGNLSAPVVAISATRDLFGAEPILIR